MARVPAVTKEFEEHDLAALVAQEIAQATSYDQSDLAAKRSRALEYLRGEMNDTPARPNGSRSTSRDLADTMSWMLPGIIRVFLSSDRMAEYEPVAPGVNTPEAWARAEEEAEQKSDYVTYVFFKDNDGYRIVYNATFNALLTGNGPVKHWWDDTPEEEISHHSRLRIEQVAALMEDEDVEILAQEVNDEPDAIADPATGETVQVETYNVKIKRTTSRGRVKIVAIEPENFLIDEAAITIDDARFCAHRDPYMTRSKLIEMGFDRELVEGLAADPNVALDTEEASSRRVGTPLMTGSPIRSGEHIDFYECYMRVDVDDDGVTETIKVAYAGSAGAGEVLHWEVWEDDLPFSDIPCYPQPHKYEADSVADRTLDIQQVKTILLRQTLDNLYASNLPMREVEQGSVQNPDILVSPKFGGTIWKAPGSAPIVPHTVPFVADKSLVFMEYLDRVIEKRTGVSRTMMALDPEALQNQTATANQNARDASYSQIELVARNMAELGWRRAFRQILKLIVKHQDRPRVIRLRDKFVEMDPRHWTATADVTVNTGLGTGSRDRDMAMLNNVLATQLMIVDRFSAAGFRAEAIEMLPRIRSTLLKIAESAGLRNADGFYPDIGEERLQAMLVKAEQQAGQPSEQMQIEMAKIEAQKQAESARLEIQKQIEAMKAEGNKIKEAAQLEGDLRAQAAERETTIMIEDRKIAFEREKLAVQAQLKQMEMQNRLDIERLKTMERENARENAARANSSGGRGEAPARQ